MNLDMGSGHPHDPKLSKNSGARSAKPAWIGGPESIFNACGPNENQTHGPTFINTRGPVGPRTRNAWSKYE